MRRLFLLYRGTREYCFGVTADGKLASATDAPTMPCMEDRVQEIGIYKRHRVQA